MKNTTKILSLTLALATFTLTSLAEMGFENKPWKLGKHTKREGNIIIVDIPVGKTDSGCAILPYDFSVFGLNPFDASIKARGFNMAAPTPVWLGFKFMATFEEATSGTKRYPGAAQLGGTWDWRDVHLSDISVVPRTAGIITLGIQEGYGRVEFDLTTLQVRQTPALWPVTNATLKCVYTPKVKALPPHRGVMLGHNLHENDFATLYDWGVTLARFQMTRNWNTVGGNRDLADYARYIDGCLNQLEQYLVWAKKYGISIVVDLHAAPGSRDERHDEYMFHDPKYAQAFIETWQHIASRFKGRPEIFGFDLINEPQQTYPAAPNCDYWTLQSRTAEAIRAIDPETPIIIESNLYDSPATFAYLTPLNLTNIIYQAHLYMPMEFTHQQVFDHNAPATTYPDAKKGWNKEYLRGVLKPVIEFQQRHNARIYIGEFSAIAWGNGSDYYIRDAISLFEEYGWDWSYHAYREWVGWSVEHQATAPHKMIPSNDNPRKRALLDGFKK